MRRILPLLFSLCLAAQSSAFAQPARGPSAADLARLGHGADDVRLTNQNGRLVRWSNLNGRPRLVFFGFTHCPAVCPTTLYLLDSTLREVGAEAANVRVDFVTVDPERDTPSILRDYLASFPGTARGYTGDLLQITRLAQSYRAAFQRRPLPGGDYTMEHTTLIYVLDSHGAVIDTIAFDTPREVVVRRVRAALRRIGP